MSTLPARLAHLADDAQALKAIERQARQKLSYMRLATFQPFPKQKELIAAGATNKTRLFLAGNRSGKSEICAYEVACHATGRYPDWWNGRKFDEPCTIIVAGHTGMTTRDVLQLKLLGNPLMPSEYGTGFIPRDCIGDYNTHRGVANAIDSLAVKHESGGWSRILFKSFEMGVERWMGTEAHVIHLDEECPDFLFTEALTRTATTRGIVLLSFTPLAGPTSLVMRFLGDDPPGAVIRATIDDNLGMTKADIEEIVRGWSPHERDARRKGIPMMGSGRIFGISDESITVDAFPIPAHWPVIGGLDFGFSTFFAAVKLAWDRESDILYLTACHKVKEETPALHAATLRAWGKGLNFSWPHDGLQAERGSGLTLAEQYRTHGLEMLAERAQFEDGGASVEAGIQILLERMTQGRFKVFGHLKEFFDEIHTYHRKEGRIVKREDHILDAVRYATMMLRYATPAGNGRFGSGPIRRGIRVI